MFKKIVIFFLLIINCKTTFGMQDTLGILPETLALSIETPEELDNFAERIEILLNNMMPTQTHPPILPEEYKEPPMPLKEWIKYIFRKIPFNNGSTFQLDPLIGFGGIILLKKILKRINHENLFGQFNVKRLFMIACLLTYKISDDDALKMDNRHWAYWVLGRWKSFYPVQLLTHLENEFLKRTDWQITPSREELIALAEQYAKIEIPGSPVSTSSASSSIPIATPTTTPSMQPSEMEDYSLAPVTKKRKTNGTSKGKTKKHRSKKY